MNRKESDALREEITGLHSEGRWLEANEHLWQAIEPQQERIKELLDALDTCLAAFLQMMHERDKAGTLQTTSKQEEVLRAVGEWAAHLWPYSPMALARLQAIMNAHKALETRAVEVLERKEKEAQCQK